MKSLIKKIVLIGLDKNNKIFIIYIVALVKLITISIYLSYTTEITLLTSAKISTKYFNFLNIFFWDSVAEFVEYTRVKNYFINLFDNKQLCYSLIYNLRSIELKMLKIYIKANLANRLIGSSKFFANSLILLI